MLEGTIVAKIAMVVVCTNLVLSGVHKALEYVKGKTKSTLDDKADSIVLKVIGVLSVASDWLAPRTSAPAAPAASTDAQAASGN